MNILYISPDFNYACGVSMHVYLLLKELSQRNELNIFLITNKGDSLDRLKKLNVKTDFIEFKRGNKNPFIFFKELFLLYKYCSKNKIKVIHSHHRYPELLAHILSKIINVKTISSVFSYVQGHIRISYKSDRIITVSDSVSRYLQEIYGVENSKIVMKYLFLENKNYKQEFKSIAKQKLFGIIDDMNIILFVGRITQVKGFDVLMQVIEKINKLNKNVLFIAVGDLLQEEFYNLYPDKRLLNYYGPQIDLSSYYSIADIVVLPSRIDPFPFIMLETGLAKKPFIGGRTGGIEEFIEDGVDGLLVEPGNVDDLYNKIVYLLNNTELQKKLGENLFQKVSKLNSPNEYCNELIKIYEDLVGDTSK
jgi:glycosyltransferase involved in cell wall biosynthesis